MKRKQLIRLNIQMFAEGEEVTVESLQQQVLDLTETNKTLTGERETLTGQLKDLEGKNTDLVKHNNELFKRVTTQEKNPAGEVKPKVSIRDTAKDLAKDFRI